MIDLAKIAESLESCPCGKEHRFDVKAVEIFSGATDKLGEILSAHNIPKRLGVVADKNTLSAANGVLEALSDAGFEVSLTLFDDLRISDEAAAERVREDITKNSCKAVLSVGTGSLNDICRWNAAKLDLPFAIFATAPSMDGFASSVAPITVNGFKRTYPAKAPEVIVADTRVLAASPAELKAAGLGDLLGKYTAHADWVVSSALTGEYYCENVARLTLDSVGRAAVLAKEGDNTSEEYAGALMEALVISGLAMQLCGNSRPASGAEHHLAHFWEMQYELLGLPPVFHGKKVGVAAGLVADIYRGLANYPDYSEHRSDFDEEAVSNAYGVLWKEAAQENFPNPLDEVPENAIEKNEALIRKVLSSVPSGDEIRALISAAGGAATCLECGISEELRTGAIKFGKYVRRRLTCMKLTDLLNIEGGVEQWL
ncbi:MAG: sn-glycerol-1-phosphate dehydrogenase [Clostridia bacterium]|nr:sn-glycerol-1-phosphate dehydrogenase [Clostridia bacterium]